MSDYEKISALTRALESFCLTIEATGGVILDPRGLAEPVGDEEWADLGSAYLEACEALNRNPMINDAT